MPTLKKEKKKIIHSCCFGCHVVYKDEKNTHRTVRFFLSQILCGSKGCGLTKAGKKMEGNIIETELHCLCPFFCVAVFKALFTEDLFYL